MSYFAPQKIVILLLLLGLHLPAYAYQLSLLKTGSGNGTVQSSLAGIKCGNACSADFSPDSMIVLKATLDSGSYFSGWSGDACNGNVSLTCQMTMDAAKSVTASFVSGAPTVAAWALTMGGMNWDEAVRAVPTLDGGYLAVGNTSSFGSSGISIWLTRYDAAGSLLWQEYIDLGGNPMTRASVHDARPTADGGFIIAGENYEVPDLNDPSVYYTRGWLAKVTASGAAEWVHLIGGTVSGSGTFLQLVLQTADSGYLAAGGADGGGFAVKLDQSGTPLWQKSYADVSMFSALQQTADGGYIAAGMASGGGGILAKLDASGQTEWGSLYTSSTGYETFNSVQQTADGGYIAAGRTYDYDDEPSYGNSWVLKTDQAGAINWQQIYNLNTLGTGNSNTNRSVVNSVRQLGDGSYIIAGGFWDAAFRNSAWLARLNGADGSPEWQKLITPAAGHSGYANSIQETADGGYIAAGWTDLNDPAGDFWLFKLTADGDTGSCPNGFQSGTEGLTGATSATSATASSASSAAAAVVLLLPDSAITVTPAVSNGTFTGVCGTFPPYVTSINPARNATSVAVNGASIRAQFSTAMTGSTLNTANIQLTSLSDSSSVPLTVTYDTATASAVVTPNAALSGSTGYRVAIKGPGGVRSAAGFDMAADYSWDFTTQVTATLTMPPAFVIPSDVTAFQFTATFTGKPADAPQLAASGAITYQSSTMNRINDTHYSYTLPFTGSDGQVTMTLTTAGVPTVTGTFTIDGTAPNDIGPFSAGPSAPGTITLTWSSAADAGVGLAATPYTLVRAAGTTRPADCSGTPLYSGSSLTFTDGTATPGSDYSYRVCSTDKLGHTSIGRGVTTTSVNAPLGAPVMGTATPGNGQASVSFTPPATDAASPVYWYTVTANPGGKTAMGIMSPVTVYGLDNNTSYSFTVTAGNGAGSSVPSGLSNAVTPSAAGPLQSHFLSSDINALQIMAGTPFDTKVALINYNIDQNSFAFKLLSGFLMLGYQTETGSTLGYTDYARRVLHTFQKNNSLPFSDLVNAACLSVIDQQLVQREQQLAPIAATFPLYNYMQPLHPNAASKDTVAALYAMTFNVLPSSLQMGYYEYVQCIAGQCNGFIQEPGGRDLGDNSSYVNIDSDFRFVGAYFDPRGHFPRLPSAAVGLHTNIHEFGHYIDGFAKNIFTDLPHFGAINTTDFYSIGYDLNDSNNTYTCKKQRSTDPKDWITRYAAQIGAYGCSDGYGIMWEDWAESFSMYVTAGRDFRVAAMQSTYVAARYTWLKANEFGGAEFDTNLPRDVESGCNDVAGYTSALPGYAHCDESYVWDFTLPSGKINGACGTAAGQSFWVTPKTNLCASGTQSLILPVSGPWNWNCTGLNGGNASAPCSAAVTNTPGASFITGVAGDYLAAVVYFDSPQYDGGSPVTGYAVVSTPAGGVDSNVGSTTQHHRITGLSPFTSYTFTVIASNTNGSGPASLPSSSMTPFSAPAAPVIDTVTAGDGQVTVAFTPPAVTGGSAIFKYMATSTPGGKTGSSATGSPIVVTGLTNGTNYTFTVTAQNGYGVSAQSGASNSVIPYGITTHNISVTLLGDGSGNVHSITEGVTLTCPGTCSTTVAYGTPVTLAASESSGSSFTNWSACDSTDNKSCTVDMTTDKNPQVTFTLQQNLMIGTTPYGTLQTALDGVGTTGQTIKAKNILLPLETGSTATYNKSGVRTILKGGYISGFGSQSGSTSFDGVLKIKSGTLVIDRLMIK